MQLFSLSDPSVRGTLEVSWPHSWPHSKGRIPLIIQTSVVVGNGILAGSLAAFLPLAFGRFPSGEAVDSALEYVR